MHLGTAFLTHRSVAWGTLLVLLSGCAMQRSGLQSPVAAGLNTRDLVDVAAQNAPNRLDDVDFRLKQAEKVSELARPATMPPKRSILCLSGGGSYGAYTAGILYGWSRRGDRPQFDVVTGISTGAIIAPLVFLGPKYDDQIKDFYTTVQSRDIFNLRAVRGIFSEGLADNSPLSRKVEESLTPEVVTEIAAAHAQGRRLYIGTTELEGRRFVTWDIGAIASRGMPEDLTLIKHILLGSSAIPGFFPPAQIPVEVDGKKYVERHVDGGVSQALFLQYPYLPPELDNDPIATSLYGSDVYAIVAGKLYADAEVIRRRSLRIAGTSVSSVIYAQTRGDLVRIWTICKLTGMNFHMAALGAEFKIPLPATKFEPEEMIKMFNEGVRQIQSGDTWRKTPPGVEYGETPLKRASTKLNYVQRGPVSPGPQIGPIFTSDRGMPLPLTPIEK